MRGLNNLCYNVSAMTEKELAHYNKQQYKKKLAEIFPDEKFIAG